MMKYTPPPQPGSNDEFILYVPGSRMHSCGYNMPYLRDVVPYFIRLFSDNNANYYVFFSLSFTSNFIELKSFSEGTSSEIKWSSNIHTSCVYYINLGYEYMPMR